MVLRASDIRLSKAEGWNNGNFERTLSESVKKQIYLTVQWKISIPWFLLLKKQLNDKNIGRIWNSLLVSRCYFIILLF